MPSPLVIVINSNLFRNELGDGTSQSLDAVADEVMDIVEGIYLYLIEICCVGLDPAGSHI